MLQEQQKIFLVDDDPFCLTLMEQALRLSGFQNVHTFDSGIACLNALTQEPSVIFLDHVMGSVSGTDTLKAIKRFNPDIYVVFVSGQQQVEVAVESLKFGAFDYIVKDEQLMTKIVAAMSKIQVIQSLVTSKQSMPSSRLMAFFNLLSLLPLLACKQ